MEQQTVADKMKGAPGTWHHLKQQTGMFGFLGLSPEVVTELRGKHINIFRAHVQGTNLFFLQSVTTFTWPATHAFPSRD